MNFIKNFFSGLNIAFKNYQRANSNLWVTSLCYFSIFSLVPILAITFSIGRWLGIEKYLMVQLSNNSPLSEEILETLLHAGQNLLENTRSGVLAGLGFIFLIWSLLSILSIVEKAFDEIWMVNKKRKLIYRISYYLTLFAFFPIILVSMNSLGTLLTWHYLNLLLPYAGLAIFFTIFYILIPTSDVKFLPAFISGIFVSIFFNQIQFLLIKLQIFINTYNKIYGSFSVILIFLFWLRFIWFFIILGGHLSYFLQNREIFTEHFDLKKINFKSYYNISIKLLMILGENYLNNDSPMTLEELSKLLNIKKNILTHSIDILIKQNILIETLDNKYKLGVNIDTLTVGQVFSVLTSNGYDLHVDIPDIENQNVLIKDIIK